MRYKASLDLTSKVITLAVGALFLWINTHNFSNFETSTNRWVLIVVLLLTVTTFVICIAIAPKAYILEDDKLIVERNWKDVVISYQDITQVIAVPKGAMKYTLRTFGNGGVFGYTGKFYNSKYGDMTWYATRLGNYVLIRTTDNKNLVITPDDPDFINELINRTGLPNELA